MIERKRLTKPTREEYLANFKGKRNKAGRPKGKPNMLTRTLKEAIILAAEAEGADGKGKEGLVGYLRSVARTRPAVYTQLMGKLLPLEVQAKLMQLQLQLQAGGANNGMTGIIDEIRAMPTDDLRRVRAYVQRMMVPSRALQRTDLVNGVTDAEIIDQAKPAQQPIVALEQEPADSMGE